MNILVKNARIVDPQSSYNGQTADIYIENGIISLIDKKISKKADKIIEIKGLSVSPGWMDLFANFADPGYEFKETLDSGAAASAAGGFTDVMVIPNSNPVIDSKSQVEYIVQKSKGLPVTIHPLGAVTRKAEGNELAEMYDMRSSGALAFSDGLNGVQSAGLLLKALQYVKAFDGIIVQVPDDKSINPNGLMNEGIISTRLGLPGKPAMAEEIIVARDLKLARYTGSKIHFTGISSKKSLNYIQRGKESGIQVTCSITPQHLCFCDEDLADYDTNLKVNPAFRTKEDMTFLRKAISDGIIDCIASHHFPHESDSKDCEFEYAKNGMTSLETAFAVLKTSLPDVNDENWVRLLSVNPRKIFGLPEVVIRENEPVCLTLFDPELEWTYDEQNIKSKSMNSPFIGKKLRGKPLGIIHKNQFVLNS